YALRADRVAAGPLLSVAALSDRLTPSLRRWLLASRPEVELRDVQLAGISGGVLRVQAGVRDARFAAVGKSPGLSGLSGALDGDGDGVTFAFDNSATLGFDWPPGFGVPHDVRLDGRVVGWRDGGGLRIETSGLRMQGIDYAAEMRGGLAFQGDGTRPSIDLAVRVDDAEVAAAQRFWVRNAMSAGTVRWLERGLVSGRVRDGRAIVSGDLDDWPFRVQSGAASKGVFHAAARLRDAQIKFLKDWPAAEHIDADIDFIGHGFTLKGRGAIAGIALPQLTGGIADFRIGELAVSADADTDAAALLRMLRQTPLRQRYAATLDALAASGPATARVAIDVPLRIKPVVAVIDGRIALGGAKLAENRAKVAFDDVYGDIAFDRSGFDATGLRTRHDGQPGLLSLRSGAGHVRDATQAFEAELDAPLSAGELIDRAPHLAWLKGYFSGRSPWHVGVSIPKSPAVIASTTTTTTTTTPATATRLRLRSMLVGTRSDLPAPLRKPAATPLATSVDTVLPFAGGEVAVAFGERLA
ncbi:MAG: YhdP family protein, partial [Luteimonas sp.]